MFGDACRNGHGQGKAATLEKEGMHSLGVNNASQGGEEFLDGFAHKGQYRRSRERSKDDTHKTRSVDSSNFSTPFCLQ